LSCSVRINAFLASAGIGSRRSVEALVREGQVTINGQVTRNLAARIDPDRDRVEYQGKTVQPLAFQYVLFHKPPGCACTRRDPHARQTIYDLLPPSLHHLVNAGRLDIDSEGMLLLSNDGQWVAQLTHPRHGIAKLYEVEVEGRPTMETLAQALHGIRSSDECLRIDTVESRRRTAKTTVLEVTLHEGRNREIRRIFGALHHPVIRLKRLSVGSLALGDLACGQWRHLTSQEAKSALK
jgi:23S rRNA pseudouridine2605 synthase